MEKWRRWVRSGIIRASRLAPIRILLRRACQLATWMVGRRLARMPGVDAVYVRHSHPRSATFAPGESDLDLTVVLNDRAAQNSAVVHACTGAVDRLSRIVWFVWPQDARFVARRELAQIEVSPGTAEILSSPSRWIRIGGREVRRDGQPTAIDGRRIALHPEFNVWWLNVMQTHALTLETSVGDSYLRTYFRVAMKSQINLEVGRGRVAPSTEAYLPNSKAASLFADDREMTELLGDLERKGFWTDDSEERKTRIFYRSLAQASEFYRNLPVSIGAVSANTATCPSKSLSEEHRSELRERVADDASLRSIAECMLVYPTPNWGPLEYQIDLVLKEDVPYSSFGEALRAIRRALGGRTFGIGGTHAQLTLIPRWAFEHPWFWLGTLFPFQHEHLANFAEVLYGSRPHIPLPPARAERLRWCAQYYLFHRFTLHYRPNYTSKDCNFCQLAALRLFLDRDMVFTDAAQVRRAYADAYAQGNQERQVLDFLLRCDAQPNIDLPFGAILEFQSRAYDAVEALLRREGVFC